MSALNEVNDWAPNIGLSQDQLSSSMIAISSSKNESFILYYCIYTNIYSPNKPIYYFYIDQRIINWISEIFLNNYM